MRSFLRKISTAVGSLLGAILTQNTGRQLYFVATSKLQKKAQKKWGEKAKVWPRNSVLTKAFKPFASALDLSVFVPQVVSHDEWQEFSKDLSNFSTYFPWLGQVNSYDSSSRDYLESANFFILQRDPALKELLYIPGRKASRAEALVFLMKMIEKDWGYLISQPLVRINNWQVHWEVISEHFDGFKDFEMREVFNRILRFAAVSPEERKNLVQYLNNNLGKPNAEMEITPALWRFFPVLFCERHQEVPEFRDVDAFCLHQAIAWEIWQFRVEAGLEKKDLNALKNKFENLLKVAEKSFSKTEKESFLQLKKQIELLLSSSVFRNQSVSA